jgi:hypothetical protein
MDASTGRRRFLRQVGVGLTTPAWGSGIARAENAAAAATQIRAITTNLASDNERMISYRHQQHLVQSADGALHLLLNRGTLTPGPGLSLFSSFDGGTTWQFMQNFAGTDDKCTGDVKLIGDDLWTVYHTADQTIWFAQLHYDSVLQTWSVVASQQAFASTQWNAQNPALAIDEMGTVWVGFLAKSKGRLNSVGNIRVVNRPGGGSAWTDPNLVFGPTDSNATERSARPVYVPGGMGMVWTVHEVTYWSKRVNTLPDNSAWTTNAVYSGIPAKRLDDPYASHFNVATDDQGGVHLISIENFDVLYFKYAADTDTWSPPQQVDDSRNVAYAQIGVINGKLGTAFSVQRGKGGLTISSDAGTSWSLSYDLQLISTYPGVNYNTARIELPTRSTGVMPILQQYSDAVSQKLMLFKVPAP